MMIVSRGLKNGSKARQTMDKHEKDLLEVARAYRNHGLSNPYLYGEHLGINDDIADAIELQISKKPMWKADKGFEFEVARRLRCPTCNNPIVSQFVRDYKPKHCSECGQKLYWSDD